MNVDDGIISSIDNILLYKHDKEDQIRGIFQLARHIAQNEISELLADFRNKRALGMHPFCYSYALPKLLQNLNEISRSIVYTRLKESGGI